MDNRDEDAGWFKNIQKSDKSISVDIIPSENVRLRASSSNPSHTVRNLTDNNPSTKWVSNYNIGTYKDDFYTNRKITEGDYSRGQIVNDGKNRKLLYDNQKAKETLQNKKIYFLKKKIIGIFNVCGDQYMSRLNFIKSMFKFLNIDDVSLKACSIKKFDNKIYFPKKLNLSNKKIKSKLRFKFTNFTKILNKIYA